MDRPARDLMERFRERGREVSLFDQARDQIKLFVGKIFFHQAGGIDADVAAQNVRGEIVCS